MPQIFKMHDLHSIHFRIINGSGKPPNAVRWRPSSGIDRGTPRSVAIPEYTVASLIHLRKHKYSWQTNLIGT